MSSYIKTKTNKKKHAYKGNKNQTILPNFIKLCKMSQKELIGYLPIVLKEKGYDVIVEEGFIYARGEVPILLTAHMDTVHKELVKDFYERKENGKHIISSPQGIGGDDRCGIYMIMEIINTHKCSVLFCEDEEIGCIGSRIFCETDFVTELSDLYYLIELDRANSDDAVFYDCDNPAFTRFITSNTGYNNEWGSYSDISWLAPEAGVAAVNLSCGYYHAHTTEEEVVIEEMLNTIEVVKKLIDVSSEQFKYIKSAYSYDDYYYDRYYCNYTNNYRRQGNNKYIDDIVVCLFVNITEKEDTIVSKGKTEDEAWRNLFKNNPTICYNDIIYFDYVYE